MNDKPTEPGPALIDLLPRVRNGKLRLCQFPSTVQIIHDISEFRSVVVAEFPKPYQAQNSAWWRQRISEESADYLRRYQG